MAKLFALKKIVLAGDVLVLPKTVFDATPAEARQFDALGAARPATAEEIQTADANHARENGLTVGDVKPASGAAKDPQVAAKVK